VGSRRHGHHAVCICPHQHFSRNFTLAVPRQLASFGHASRLRFGRHSVRIQSQIAMGAFVPSSTRYWLLPVYRGHRNGAICR
jgi:hypothetical protein